MALAAEITHPVGLLKFSRLTAALLCDGPIDHTLVFTIPSNNEYLPIFLSYYKMQDGLLKMLFSSCESIFNMLLLIEFIMMDMKLFIIQISWNLLSPFYIMLIIRIF